MNLTVTKYVTGPIETNTYLVESESKHGLVFDPSFGCKALLDRVQSGEIVLDAIVLTHGHFDHIMGISEIQSLASIPVFIHKDDQDMLRDPRKNFSVLMGNAIVYEGEICELIPGKMHIGSFDMEIIHVPGHSPGGCAILIEDYCFCGDILFAGSIGRADFPGSDPELLISGILQNLLTLPDTTIVCPGHGGRTSIGRERRMNPFLS